jgi:hypothetical protein
VLETVVEQRRVRARRVRPFSLSASRGSRSILRDLCLGKPALITTADTRLLAIATGVQHWPTNCAPAYRDLLPQREVLDGPVAPRADGADDAVQDGEKGSEHGGGAACGGRGRSTFTGQTDAGEAQAREREEETPLLLGQPSTAADDLTIV